jgi:hypothetical protein
MYRGLMYGMHQAFVDVLIRCMICITRNAPYVRARRPSPC